MEDLGAVGGDPPPDRFLRLAASCLDGSSMTATDFSALELPPAPARTGEQAARDTRNAAAVLDGHNTTNADLSGLALSCWEAWEATMVWVTDVADTVADTVVAALSGLSAGTGEPTRTHRPSPHARGAYTDPSGRTCVGLLSRCCTSWWYRRRRATG